MLDWNNFKQRSESLMCCFFIECEQTQHPLWTQLSHWLMFMQNSKFPAFWHLQLNCYLTQLQFMIGQNEFVEFFDAFSDNCWIWATWAFNIICVCTTALKVSILPLNCYFEEHLSSHGFAWRVFFPIRKQCFINTRNSDFLIVLKICSSSFT